jgi:hypothetical protein
VTVHPYPYYIGIRQATDNLVNVPRGGEVKFDVLGIKPDGERVKDKELTATLYRREWRYSLRDNGRNRYRYHWTREDVPVTDERIKLSEEPAGISFHIQQWGSYLIEVKDPEDNVVSSRRFRAGRWWRVSGARRVDFDRLDVSFDRDNYKPGDQVKIKIDAPYDGTAYIFREDREIKYMDSVKVEDLEAEFSFEVDSSYPGNSYISVLLLRGNEDVDVNSFRAIGVAPFKVEQEDKIIEVGYKFPEPLTPGETVPVQLELRDREGRLIDGEVALSIVDQGILQLTKHRFSDPYSHFYRKRGYFIKNRDIFGMLNAEPDTGLGGVLEPSGDAPKEAEMPDRMEPFNFVSSWYPSLKVKDGKARLQHPIPEFSGRLVMRAWAISEDKTGYARTTKNIRQPLIVRPTLPRAVAPGDEFEFPVEVTSNLEDKQVIKISFDSDRQLVIDNEGLVLELDPGGRERIMVSASVKMGIGNIGFDINVSGEDINIERNYLLPVLPPYPTVNENKFRVIDAPDNREITVEPMFYPSTASSRVVVSTMPSVELLSGLRYLIRYPHGCVEQITSRVFPQLYLRRLLMLTDWDRDREDEIELNINQGISKIVSRTLPDGSFSMWPGGNSTYYHGSIYAAHFLVEARRAGYAVPDGVIKRVKNWLEDRVKYDKEKSKRHRRAYALYVLALTGEYNVPLAKKLLKEIDDYSQYYAVGALLLAGEKDAVKDYLYDRTPMLGQTERRTYGRLRSRVIAEAVALNALLEADEDLPVMDSLAANILRRAKFKNRWGSTHENAQALIALARYFERRPPEETDFEGYLVLDGSDTLYFNSEEDTGIDIEREFKSLRINLEGTGPLYLSTTRRGIPVEGLQEEISRDMNVQHRFYDLKGNPHGSNTFKQGKLYVVQTSVKTPRRLGNLYFADLLPGGFEIENRRIATRAMDIPFLTRRRAYLNNTEYIDVRDDRVIMFFNSRSRHTTYSFRYLVRAVTRGKFQHPPVSGGCMYDPDVQVLKFNDPIIIK